MLDGLREAAQRGEPAALRDAWRQALEALGPSDGPQAADPGSCRRRSDLHDALLLALQPPPGALIVAAGGYGRRELAPHSDVDLLVVVPEDGDRAGVERTLRQLWDAGIEVGHAVRTLEGVSRSLRSDLAAATALLEGRRLCGEPAALRELRGCVREFLAQDALRYARAKLAEAQERHASRGDAVCLLAPDLKAGRGTCRDLQLVMLLAAVARGQPPESEAGGERVLPALERTRGLLAEWLGYSPAELAALDHARALLLASRSALHEEAAERTERLDAPLQRSLAARFGYRDREGRPGVELFMDQVYRCAQTVDRALLSVRLELEPAPADRFHTRPVAAGLAARGDELVLEGPPPAPAEVPARLAALFLQAQRGRRRLGPRTLDQVRRVLLPLAGPGLRRDPAALAGLRDLLAAPSGVAPVLRAMHRSGYLGALLPEVGALECLAQADPYHAYTVDEHTLAVMDALEGRTPGEAGAPAPMEREDQVRLELLQGTGRRDLLRLGVLLHDAGKVGGSLGHVERGEALVPGVAERLGLDLEEERHVRFLVREHLTLSRLAERRDVDAPETLDALLEAVEHDPERLDHLYLLTCADVRGVSPQAMTRWKDYLLTRLHQNAHEALLAGGGRGRPRPTSPEEWLGLLRERGVEPIRAEAHLRRCTRAYLLEARPEEVLLHLRLLEELDAAGVALHCSLDEGCERLWVAARDRAGLFADLCGAISGSSYEILAASTFARDDGVVFDHFALSGPPGPPEARWGALMATIRGVLAGALSPTDLLAARARRERAPDAALPPPVRVRATNEASPSCTIVEVSAPDRLGLLYDLARALADAGCDIRLAKVATKGDRAVDVFHVTDALGHQLGPARLERLLQGLRRASGCDREAGPDVAAGYPEP